MSRSTNSERASLRATTPEDAPFKGRAPQIGGCNKDRSGRGMGNFTSHISLTFKHHEGVAPVRLSLLVGLQMIWVVLDDANLEAKGQHSSASC